MARPNQARLDLEALRHNLGVARELTPRSRLMAVVKANAYGHGAITIARELEPLADALAVACIEEAVELREAGINAPILLLQGVFEAAELDIASHCGFWITIDNERQLSWLEHARLDAPLQCWLKVDTGMHRLGVTPERTRDFHQRLQHCVNALDEVVLSTHLASADDLDSAQTPQQLQRFERACDKLACPRSAANSPGLLAWPQSHYDWVRPGYMLYGNSPFAQPHPNAEALRPVMTLVSGIISLREFAAGETVGYGGSWTATRPSRIATVTVGYGDGYPRLAPNGTPVLIRGQRAPLAGRVSMDMITVDVTDLAGVEIGDEVILWGPELPAAEVARHAGTIGYELTTRMPPRAPRVVIRP
jgi:alanine racemase